MTLLLALLISALMIQVAPPALGEEYATQAPVGAISGTITDESGFPVPQGRVEVYAETGELVAMYMANLSGSYQTDLLEPGTYYFFMYNGDDDFFIGWFPQWFGGATMLRSDRAQGVTITTGHRTGIDAQLLPLYDDMFDSVFEQSIAWMQYTAITQGCAPTLYCPDDPVTRGQMAAFLVRALFLPPYGGPDRFRDDNGHIFENAIESLAQAGITIGCNPPVNDRFCPDDLVTRGQMAAFLVRALGLPEYSGPDRFRDDNGHIFESAIERLAQAGITQGCNPPVNDRFCPDDLVSRGQMAAFLKRALEVFYPFDADAPTMSSLGLRPLVP